MPIETDLSVSPYFDEAAAGLEKNYYKVLFKPSVPVQVRELNELQSILQNQIEEFGDNVLKRGTIIRGCTFSFFNNYPYVKIKDVQVDTAPINVSELLGKSVTSSTGHKAIVINYAEGFESTDPDTKTLYLRYTNSGDGAGNTNYSAGDILTVQDPAYSVSKVTISTAGTGYSNSDSVIFVSTVAVVNVSGTLVNGATMTQTTSGANAVIIGIDAASYPDKTILRLRPIAGDATNAAASANAWTFNAGDSIVQLNNSAVTAVISESIGSGASAVVTTDGSQRVVDISMVSGGSGYYITPYAAVRSTAGGSGAALAAQNYFAKITVYNGANAVGTGYGFGVSEGVVYQKGYFLNVPEQAVVVSKYNRFPNNVSVGFSTAENIVDAYEDTALLDNALGTRNYTAPGADRLQLNPTLEVVNTDIAKANLEFLAIVEFSEGVPYKQNQRTVYNGINDEMASRTFDSSGDFVTDQFLVACKSSANLSLRANTFTVVVDPGTAYIEGYKVKTYGNYQFTLDKGTDIAAKNTANVSLNFGSYIVVDDLAGSFDFSAVGTVKLYNTAANYLSNSSLYSAGTIAAPAGGTQIGTAKVRSIVYVDGSSTGYPQGSPLSKYNMYIFDIQMSPGRSFKDVKSVFYDPASGPKGIADVVLENITSAGVVANSTTTVYGAVLKNTVGTDKKTLDKLIFYSGFDSPLSINTFSYQYRTFDDSGTTYTMSNTGIIELVLSGNEYFPYNTDLSDSQKQQVVIMPLNTVYANAAAGGAGNANISSTSNVISSTNSSFTTSLRIGDYIRLSSNSTGGQELRRIVNIANGTHLTVDANSTFTNALATVTRTFPSYIPIPILTRDGITATANSSAQKLTVDLGTRLFGSSTTIPLAASFNISLSNAPITEKSANRDLFVKIFPANNSTGFGYSQYGTGVDGYFNSGSNVVSNTTTSAFSANQNIKIVSGTKNFLATVNTISNSTQMSLKTTVNFTGNADIYAAVNLNGPWCLGVPDIFRLKAVYVANTVNVNTNSTEVTRDFVVDHNHNSNFADLGFLVKKKESALVIGPNDYLLVKFDAFTRNYEDRPVHINSYVSSNSVTRANVDAKPLSNLNNSYINTFEIPEIHSSAGTNYDMISYLDFRPKVSNTADLATTAGTATLNPSYTVAFSATNKKFPVPDSIASFNTSYFQGRIDTVYLGADGRIGTARGQSNTATIINSTDVDDVLTPVPRSGTMILNHIKVPAYPSLEENPAQSLAEVVDKMVINDVKLSRRNSSKLITRILTKQNIELEQPRRYSMEDIGSLERRIRDLEYYVALTNLEISTKDLNLPSSMSPNINRFKFGFFADAFDDTTYSDIDSVEYAAGIENKRAVPSYEMIKIEVPGGDSSYTNYSVVSQSRATGNALPICVSRTAYQETQGQEKKIGNARISTAYLTMANNLAQSSGRVDIYLYFFSGADVMRIYQSQTANNFPANPIITTGAAVPPSTADKAYMRALPDKFFSTYTLFGGISLDKHQKVSSPQNGLRWAGKMTFDHNPANGRYYKIEVQNHSIVWRYRIEYPINVSCQAGQPLPGGGASNYNGVLSLADTKQSKSIKQVKVTNSNLSASYYRIWLKVSGLKPSTKHKIYFSGQDLTHLCDTSVRNTVIPIPPLASTTVNLNWQNYASQIPDFFNDAPDGYIMTDAAGKIEMYLYVLQDETPRINSNRKTEYETVKNPVIEIYTPDKSSYAHRSIETEFKLFSGFRIT